MRARSAQNLQQTCASFGEYFCFIGGDDAAHAAQLRASSFAKIACFPSLSGRTRALKNVLHVFWRAARARHTARSAENLRKKCASFGAIARHLQRRRCTRGATSRNFYVEIACFSWCTLAERAHFCMIFARNARAFGAKSAANMREFRRILLLHRWR